MQLFSSTPPHPFTHCSPLNHRRPLLLLLLLLFSLPVVSVSVVLPHSLFCLFKLSLRPPLVQSEARPVLDRRTPPISCQWRQQCVFLCVFCLISLLVQSCRILKAADDGSGSRVLSQRGPTSRKDLPHFALAKSARTRFRVHALTVEITPQSASFRTVDPGVRSADSSLAADTALLINRRGRDG